MCQVTYFFQSSTSATGGLARLQNIPVSSISIINDVTTGRETKTGSIAKGGHHRLDRGAKERKIKCKQTKIERASVAELDKILGRSFPVLDHGHVRIIDYMGDDAAIVQAARVSYGAGTKQVHEDRGLIRYLLRNAHTTPFEMCKLKLHIRVPMDCWRQWIRHRTASVNEYSTRYSEAISDQQGTLPGEWRLQTTQNKQGSDGFLDPDTGEQLTASEEAFHQSARELYQSRIALRCCP